MNFIYSVSLKYFGVACTLNDILPIHDSIASGIDCPLENIGSLSYTDLSNVDTFHYNDTKNLYSLIILRILLGIYILGSCYAHSDRYKFSNILIFAGKFRFYH